ncbi:hypothetical protein [Canibacter oris]|uniref:XRE family transcriptional regulator n=1 Tax=Canibacter oris TaxID=1365628 RepID=A0A840DH28_9MICO|nr:hypothetical protein [Canibacter oris]MBB4072030.1 hypothetical protein [Canibacter oris]
MVIESASWLDKAVTDIVERRRREVGVSVEDLAAGAGLEVAALFEVLDCSRSWLLDEVCAVSGALGWDCAGLIKAAESSRPGLASGFEN